MDGTASAAAVTAAAPPKPKSKKMTPVQRRRLGVILGSVLAALILVGAVVAITVILLRNKNTVHNFQVPANAKAPADRGPPVACPVNSSNFCTLLGRAESVGGCHFDASWVNAQCEMACPTIIDFWLGVTYPKRTMGLFRRPDPKIDNSSAAASDPDHNAACALASAFYGLAQNPVPNAGSAAEPGFQNFYGSIASCIHTSYYCG